MLTVNTYQKYSSHGNTPQLFIKFTVIPQSCCESEDGSTTIIRDHSSPSRIDAALVKQMKQTNNKLEKHRRKVTEKRNEIESLNETIEKQRKIISAKRKENEKWMDAVIRLEMDQSNETEKDEKILSLKTRIVELMEVRALPLHDTSNNTVPLFIFLILSMNSIN